MAVGSDLAPQGVVLVSRGVGVAVGSDIAPRRRWARVSTLIICECYGDAPAVPHHLTMLFGTSTDLPRPLSVNAQPYLEVTVGERSKEGGSWMTRE